MPFADMYGLVTMLPKPLPVVRHVGKKFTIIRDYIVFTGISTGCPTSSRRAADWVGCVAFREVHASLRQAIYIGCIQVWIAMTTKSHVTKLIEV